MKEPRYVIGFLPLLLAALLGLQPGSAVPTHFPEPVYDLSVLSEAEVDLGRALFYDPVLSADSSISCASCHSPYNAFAHTDHALSHGIGDSIGTRNAPALFNLAWQSSFMWDGASNHLDVQALAPISHPAEMGEDIKNVVRKLQRSSLYRQMFQRAFGDSLASGAHTLKALAAFQLTLVSADAKYDQVQEGKALFSEQEERGYALFRQYCNSCHREPLFSSYGFADNGLPMDSSLMDWGRGKVTLQSADSLKFKIPSLRNLQYTSPYMHDGRFKKLREVVNHYREGLAQRSSLAPELQDPIPLKDEEVSDLIAFLLTLNDPDFVFDPKHQFPWEILLGAAFSK